MVSELERFFEGSPELDSFLFTSLGSEESGGMHDGFNALVSVLERGAPSGLQWDSRLVEESDHGNNSQRSTPSALLAFWEFWRETRGPPGSL